MTATVITAASKGQKRTRREPSMQLIHRDPSEVAPLLDELLGVVPAHARRKCFELEPTQLDDPRCVTNSGRLAHYKFDLDRPPRDK